MKRILVVEDEFLIGLEIASTQTGRGVGDCQHVDSETEALQRIQEEHWDAVIADANLNGQAIDRVATLLYERCIPFLVVTGYARETLPALIKEAPILEKPFNSRRLVAAVTQILQTAA